MSWQTDPAQWLEAQPDLITCPAYHTKMTLRACKKRLKSPFHYEQLLHPNEPQDGMVINVGFRGCASGGCPHYEPTKKRANVCRTNFGVFGRKSVQERLRGSEDVYDFHDDIRTFHSQSASIHVAKETREKKAPRPTKLEAAKIRLQSAYAARRAAGTAKRLKQDEERVGKQARAEKMASRGKSAVEIAAKLGVHENTIRRWGNEGPSR